MSGGSASTRRAMNSSVTGCGNLNSPIARMGSDIRRRLAVGLAGIAAALFTMGAAPGAGFTFIGNWYGVGEPDDPGISYIDSYSADGSFRSEFRKCQRGEMVWRQTETGKWSVSGGMLRMISDTIDG